MKNYSASDMKPLTVHKESSGKLQLANQRTESNRSTSKTLGLSWQIRPLRPTEPPAEPADLGSSMYTGSSEAQDGVNLGTVDASDPMMGRPFDGVEPGHTPRPRVGREVRMLLSFQRPSRLSGRGLLPMGAPGIRIRVPGRTDEYSAGRRARTGGYPRAGV